MLPRLTLVLVLGLMTGLRSQPAAAQAADDKAQTTRTVVFLLRSAARPDPQGRYLALLRALRQLRDPELAPLFASLTESERPALRVNGFLGLAECSTPRQLDLSRLVAEKDGQLQAEVITRAMDLELLPEDQERQALGWTNLDATVRLLLARHPARTGQFQDWDLLKQAATSDKVGRQALAGLLYLQCGRPEAAEVLGRVQQSRDPQRDASLEMALSLAIQFEFDRAGPWAMQMHAQADPKSNLRLAALQTALRFKAAGAAEAWRQALGASTDPAQRARLAFLALGQAAHLDAALFDPLIQSDDPLLRGLGAAGAAVASGRQVTEALTALVKLRQPVATDWALAHARKKGTPEEVRQVALTVIQAYTPRAADERTALNDAAEAARLLCEKDPAGAAELLRPMLAARATDGSLLQALLMGLVRARQGQPHTIIEGLPPFEQQPANDLAIVLQAVNGVPLDAERLAALGLVVRRPLPDELRLIAGWAYLKATGQAQAVLAQQVIGR